MKKLIDHERRALTELRLAALHYRNVCEVRALRPAAIRRLRAAADGYARAYDERLEAEAAELPRLRLVAR